MKTLTYLIIALIAFSFTSCQKEESSSVAQDRIYTIYEVVYENDRDVTTVKAVFRFGNEAGTLLKLSTPSSVKFNNDQLNYDETFSYYHFEYAGQPKAGTFTWTDYEGKEYKNNFASLASAELPETLTTLKKSESYSMSWVGTPLADKAWLTVTFNVNNSGVFKIFTQNATGASNILLDKQRLSEINDGNSKVAIHRYTDIPLTQKTSAGGRMTGTWVSASKTINVTQ